LIEVYTNVPANNFYITTEGSGLTITAINETPSTIPIDIELKQNYPNPFNPGTNIQYTLNDVQFVNLKVYDSLGKEVSTLVNEDKPAGIYEIEFNGSKLSSGVYYYRMQAGNFSDTKKFIIMK
jgi:hypothetical protein